MGWDPWQTMDEDHSVWEIARDGGGSITGLHKGTDALMPGDLCSWCSEHELRSGMLLHLEKRWAELWCIVRPVVAHGGDLLEMDNEVVALPPSKLSCCHAAPWRGLLRRCGGTWAHLNMAPQAVPRDQESINKHMHLLLSQAWDGQGTLLLPKLDQSAITHVYDHQLRTSPSPCMLCGAPAFRRVTVQTHHVVFWCHSCAGRCVPMVSAALRFRLWTPQPDPVDEALRFYSALPFLDTSRPAPPPAVPWDTAAAMLLRLCC